MAWFTPQEVGRLTQLFNQYYLEHEALISRGIERNRVLESEISSLKLNYEWSKSGAMFLQIFGLIMVFLKDFKAKSVEKKEGTNHEDIPNDPTTFS